MHHSRRHPFRWLLKFAGSGLLAGAIMTAILLVVHNLGSNWDRFPLVVLIATCSPMLALSILSARHHRSSGIAVTGASIATAVFVVIGCISSELIEPGEFNTIAFMPVIMAFPGSLIWSMLAISGCVAVQVANRRHPLPPSQTCPKCGYSLKGLPTKTCPECGGEAP